MKANKTRVLHVSVTQDTVDIEEGAFQSSINACLFDQGDRTHLIDIKFIQNSKYIDAFIVVEDKE